MTIFVAVVLWLAGPSVRSETDQRIGVTVASGMSLGFRYTMAAGSLHVIKAFPLFGVGLGSWPEIFPRFQGPPSFPLFANHAHNDYLELAADIGLIGMAGFIWLAARLIASFRSAAKSIEPGWWPWFAALIAGLVFLASHELLEFNLHRSANVFLLCGVIAAVVRLSGKSTPDATGSRGMVYAYASLGALGAPLLAFLAATHQPLEFGRWPAPDNRKQAVDQIVSYPADVQPHLALARFDRTPTPQAIRELEIASWVEPLNPLIRDEYAQVLYEAGQQTAEARQIETSVMYSPTLSDHFYLTKDAIASLSGEESSAVENGFRSAIRKGYPGAVEGLASFYNASDRQVEAAELYLNAAGQEQEAKDQERFLIAAGEAFGKAGKRNEAQSAFEKAANVDPSDSNPYLDVLTVVYGPANDMKAAQSTVETGIRNGVDPIVLFSTLAGAAQSANNPEVASAALTKMVEYSPTLQNAERLAESLMASGKPDRAVDAMRKATMNDPNSAEAYLHLASTEEAAYLYADADRDFSRALALDPNNSEVKSRYAEFQQRTADKGAASSEGSRN
jgi:tetratricopeptide (TPR) repeat protein